MTTMGAPAAVATAIPGAPRCSSHTTDTCVQGCTSNAPDFRKRRAELSDVKRDPLTLVSRT